MDDEKIKKLMDEGENEKIEFKKNFDKETVETAVAFANAGGGIILIGVTDKGDVSGVSIGKETLKEWTNKISQLTEPTMIPEMKSYIVDGKCVVVIAIKEVPIKPVAYKGTSYLRIGNGNRKLGPKEIAELHLHTTGSSWDGCLADAKFESIELEKVRTYVKLANQTGRRKIKDGPIDVLKKLDLVKNNRPTWASILLFGKEPQKFVPQAKIHCGRFKDGVTIIDDETVEGDVIEQVDEALDFVKKHLKVRFEIGGEPKRKEIWEYPLPAIREAVINAVCHRDYAEPSEIQIRIYEDRLVVWNPGKLPLGISLEELRKPHKSVLRNKLIAQIFHDIGFIEKWGTGIERMVGACLNEGLPEPKFEEYQGFRVIFRKDAYTEERLKSLGLNERQIKAVEYAKRLGNMTNKAYRELFGVSKKTASRELSSISARGVFERKGFTGKGTFYLLAGQRGHKGVTKGSQRNDL